MTGHDFSLLVLPRPRFYARGGVGWGVILFPLIILVFLISFIRIKKGRVICEREKREKERNNFKYGLISLYPIK